MTPSSHVAILAVASLLVASAAIAQSNTSAPAKTATAPPKAQIVHTAASLECSKEADAKDLHGKERKKFRSECKKTAAKPH